MLLNPLGGRFGDRAGYVVAVPLGMVVLAVVLPVLPLARNTLMLISLAVAMGAAQALVFPSTIAMVSARVREGRVATGMGLVGTMRNAGKVAGPVVAGALIHWLDYALTFRLMGLALLVGAGVVWWRSRASVKRADAAEQNAVTAAP